MGNRESEDERRGEGLHGAGRVRERGAGWTWVRSTLPLTSKGNGHHRDGRGFAGEDRGFGDDRILADGAEGEFLIVFGDDVAGEDAAVLGVNRDELVGFLDLFAGVDDRREDVVKVGTVRAGFLVQAEVRVQAAENP